LFDVTEMPLDGDPHVVRRRQPDLSVLRAARPIAIAVLMGAKRCSFAQVTEVAPHLVGGKRLFEHLASANRDSNTLLQRLALKLATGAGKTTVMARSERSNGALNDDVEGGDRPGRMGDAEQRGVPFVPGAEERADRRQSDQSPGRRSDDSIPHLVRSWP
jgi:hypothetical protein